jgi:hypothetical protein
MDESDLKAEETLPRLGVDQLGPCCREPFELDTDVVDLVGNVMHARAAARQEPADGSLGAKRGEQLDTAGADQHGRRLDSLVIDLRPVLELGAEESLVRCEGLVEVVNGDAEMMDAAGLHGSDAIGHSGRGAPLQGVAR